MVSSQTSQRAFDSTADDFRFARQFNGTCRPFKMDIGHIISEFGGDDHLISERLKSLANKFLIFKHAINLGRIEKSDTGFNSLA